MKLQRKTLIAIAALGLMTFGFTGPAQADGDGHEGPVPEHGHVLLLDVAVEWHEGGPELAGFRKCIDLANGNSLRNNAHHENAHDGIAGNALFLKAGNAVVPTHPLWPGMNGCADLEIMFGK
jgi:hypothetical protein